MPSNPDLIEFICSQIADAGVVRSRKLFGEYVIYVDEKAVILVCDDIAYVKIHPAIADLMQGAETGYPFDGAREHYILDVEHRSHAVKVVRILAEVLDYPKKKNRRKRKA